MGRLKHSHGFGVVLVLVLVSASFQVAAPETDLSLLITILLGAAILTASVWAARAEGLVARAAVLVAVVLALGSTAVILFSDDVPRGAAAIVSGLLVAVAPAVVAGGVVRDMRLEGGVSVRTLSGVLAIYLLAGMFFSFLNSAVAELGDSAFFVAHADATRSDFLYFSYITLSTTGYGDYVPATDLGQMLSVTEALIGQIYLVTIVALIVANLRPRGRAQPQPPAD